MGVSWHNYTITTLDNAKNFTVCRPSRNSLNIALQIHVSWLPEFFSILDTKIEWNVSVVLKQWKIDLRVMILFHHTGTVWIVSSFAVQITLTYPSVQHLRTRGHKIIPPCWLPQRAVPQHRENHVLHCQALWLRECLKVRTMSWLQLLQHPQTLFRLPRTLQLLKVPMLLMYRLFPNDLLNSFLVQTQSILTREVKQLSYKHSEIDQMNGQPIESQLHWNKCLRLHFII